MSREPEKTELLQGTLHLLILKILEAGPMHGYGISMRLEQVTRGTFQVNPGSLFPALHKMDQRGWLRSDWGKTENNRRAKYYHLTDAGRRQLEAERRSWDRVTVAIGRVLALET